MDMRLTERFDRAFLFASELHRDQIRKGSRVPYLAHLLAVTAIVLENGAEEETAIAALLHDAIEDQGGAATREEIRRRFGSRVVEIVDRCTDAETIPKPPWRERKEAYIAHVAEAPEAVRLVSCADKLHNARAIVHDYRAVGEALWKRFTGGRAGTLWYYRALADTFLETGPFPLAEELNRVVQEMEALSGENHRETTAF
jgi:GTP pyrophosphokinase